MKRFLKTSLLFLGSFVFLPIACLSPNERQQQTMRAVEEAEHQGDTERAIAILDRALAYDPRDLTMANRLAELYAYRGRFDRACETLRRIPSDVPFDLRFRQLLARCSLALGQLDRALEALIILDRAGALDSEILDAWLDQAAKRLFPLVSKHPQAWHRRWFDNVLANGNLAEVAHRLPYANLSEEDRSQLFENLLVQATRSQEIDFLASYEEELRAKATPTCLFLLHRLMSNQKRLGEAAEIEDRFLESHPEHPKRFPLLLSKARREVRRGRAEEGLLLAEEAVALRPDHPGPFIERGLALRALGRHEEADLAFELALGIDSKHPIARKLTGRRGQASDRAIHIHLGEGHREP